MEGLRKLRVPRPTPEIILRQSALGSKRYGASTSLSQRYRPPGNGRALRLDPSLPEAHALLGVWAGTFSYDWNEAERRWRLAMAREPVSRDVRFWYGNHYLLPIGRPAEAVEAMAWGLEGDPLNLLYRHHWARGLRHAGRLEDAEAELRKVLELDENNQELLRRSSGSSA